MKNFGFQWHISDHCNLRCKHCYQVKFNKSSELSLEKIKFIVDKLSLTLKDKFIMVNITGGEPFLRDDLFDILSYIEDKKNFKEFNIITNATLIDNEKIDRLNKFNKFKYLKISLESANEKKNDYIRGKGNFKKVIENIKLFKKNSNKKILFMITIGSLNFKEISNFLDFSKDLKVNGVILERFVPIGRGLNLKEFYLKNKEWHEVLKIIIYYLDLNLSPYDLLPYKAFWIDLKNSKLKGALCNLGDESMALMPNGDIYPCRRLPIVIGNILNEDFGEIIVKLKNFKDNTIENLKGKCKNCEIQDCIGCRALTYAIKGDLFEEDPQCFL